MNTVIELYANLVLWITGGAISHSLLLFFVPVIIGTALIVIPIWFMLKYAEASRGRTGWKLKDLAMVIALPTWFFAALMLTMVVGINGNQEFHSKFRECVQLEDRTVVIPQTVMVRMCRDRDNVNNEFGAWAFNSMLHNQQFYNTPIVEELPEG